MPFSFKVGGVGGKLTMSLDAIAAANKKAAAAAPTDKPASGDKK